MFCRSSVPRRPCSGENSWTVTTHPAQTMGSKASNRWRRDERKKKAVRRRRSSCEKKAILRYRFIDEYPVSWSYSVVPDDNLLRLCTLDASGLIETQTSCLATSIHLLWH